MKFSSVPINIAVEENVATGIEFSNALTADNNTFSSKVSKKLLSVNTEEQLPSYLIDVEDSNRYTKKNSRILTILHDSKYFEHLSETALCLTPLLVVVEKIPSALKLPLHNQVKFVVNPLTAGKSEEYLELWESYTVTVQTPVMTSRIAHWSASTGLVGYQLDWPSRRTNLLGAQLICLIEQQEPASFLKKSTNGWKIEGWVANLVKALEVSCNFSCSFRPAADRRWGGLNPNGTWNGMVREISQGLGDVIMATLDNTVERGTQVDFLIPIDTSSYAMAIRANANLGSFWTRYLSEFSSGVWWCLGALILLCAAIIRLVFNLSPSCSLNITFCDALVLSFAPFAYQGDQMMPKNTSGRLTMACVLLSAVLLSIHYSSSLYASLTARVSVVLFDSLKAIVDDGSYIVSLVNGQSVHTELMMSTIDYERKLYNDLVAPKGLVSNNDEGIARLMSERVIYMNIDSVLKNTPEYKLCKFELLPSRYFNRPAGMAVKKGSPLKAVLNNGLIKSISSGVLRRVRVEWDVPTYNCNAEFVSAMTLEQVMSAFILLGLGMGLSAAAFASEQIITKKRTRH